jgi:hypothetical protein
MIGIEPTSDLNTISPDTFRLPSLGPKLRSLSWEIHEGKGAVIIKGLQPDKYCLKDNIVIFAGLSSYIGDQRGRQSAQNDVLSASCWKSSQCRHANRFAKPIYIALTTRK